MRADIDIERDVKAELKWSPDVNETDIAINVTGSVVALTGYVVNSTQKYRAEAAVKRSLPRCGRGSEGRGASHLAEHHALGQGGPRRP